MLNIQSVLFKNPKVLGLASPTYNYGYQLIFKQKISCTNVFTQQTDRKLDEKELRVKKERLVLNVPLNVSKELQLSFAAGNWLRQKVDLDEYPQHFATLAKAKLTGLVVLTAMGGYTMAPAAFCPTAFIACALGTTLISASANTINQVLEAPFDSQMERTKNRLLVRGLMTPLQATTFGMASGVSGILVLLAGTNAATAALGVLNLALYTSIYTPLKRVSIINTWVGAVVGAIPPLMGWYACVGNLGGERWAGAAILGGLLYAWQFPHFNALSWNLRPDYSRAGYRMMCVIRPDLCRRTSLQYCLSITALCVAAPVVGLTTWTFFIDSFLFNMAFNYFAWRFYRDGDSKSSRRLFHFSLFHLPLVFMLMIMSKKPVPKKKEVIPNTL